MAQRVGRGIALLFHDRGTRRGVSGQRHAPAALYPPKRPGTHFTGGWVGSGRAENLVPIGIRSRIVQPVTQSVFRLSQPGKSLLQVSLSKQYEASVRKRSA